MADELRFTRDAFDGLIVAAARTTGMALVEAYPQMVELNWRFAALDLGFDDVAIVVLAEALGLTRVATTDRRHFEPLAATLSLDLLPASGSPASGGRETKA